MSFDKKRNSRLCNKRIRARGALLNDGTDALQDVKDHLARLLTAAFGYRNKARRATDPAEQDELNRLAEQHSEMAEALRIVIETQEKNENELD